MTEREAFEAWAKQPPMEWDCERFPDNGAWPGNYRYYPAQCAWEGWQARAQPAQAGQVLTDVEIMQLSVDCYQGGYVHPLINFARAIEQAVLAKRVPMTDQEILDAAEAIKTKRIEAAKQAVLDRKGSKCSRCGGVLGVDHNGYHMFNRCESCLHVPMFMSDGSEFLPPPGIVGEKGGA